jgi:GH24 family phage-related lysozyme (muramidase)
MNSFYLDSIKKFEGFAPQAQWDYAQHSNGFGTRALHAGEVIDRAEAERRFEAEIANARAVVERYAASADDGTKAALTSLTVNAGEKWTRDGLGDAVRRGDMETARSLFLEYNKAGGKVLAGLAARRAAEVEWIGGSQVNTEPVASPAPGAPAFLAALSEPDPCTPAADLWPMAGGAARVGDRAPLIVGGAVHETAAEPLLMSLRLHMALAAGDRLDRSDEGREDRPPPREQTG